VVTRENRSSLAFVSSIVADVLDAAADGAGVDLQGYDSATVVLSVGDADGTNPTFEFIVQESDDNQSFSPVAAGDLIGSLPVITGANDEASYAVAYRGVRRYLRVRLDDVGGTSDPEIPASAVVVLGHPHLRPTS
jgi:hypothetical protein